MKVLIDPIYTHEINRCASAVKMQHCALMLLRKYKDVFIYWLVPEGMTPEEEAWLPDDPRISYHRVKYFEDRYKEYWHASEEYRRLIAFSGILWDIDLVVTNRTQLVPFIKWALHRPQGVLKWSKYILLIEDMPIMSFKMFIPMSTDREGDIAALNGYLTATMTCISAYWEKRHILRIGKNYLSPASIAYLQKRIIESSSHEHNEPKLKTPEIIQRTVNKEKRFTISYAGRMVNRDFVDDSMEVILKNWVIGGDDVRMIVCTVSNGFGRVDHEATRYIELMRPDRLEFWRIMREESDVGVFMSRDEDYSMAMMEPLMQGTPLVLYRAEHAVASVGADYPFFIDSIAEGYAIVRQFKKDYASMYAKFAAWSQSSFKTLLANRNKDYLPLHLLTLVEEWRAAFVAASDTTTRNEVVQLIAAAAGSKPFKVVDMISRLEKEKKIKYSIAKKADSQFDDNRLVFSTHYDTFRVGLLKRGFKDAGPEPGYMVRGDAEE